MTPRVQLLPTGRERRFRTDHGLDKYGASYDGPDFAIFRPGYDFLYELLYRDVYGRVADCVAAFGRVAKPNADLIVRGVIKMQFWSSSPISTTRLLSTSMRRCVLMPTPASG